MVAVVAQEGGGGDADCPQEQRPGPPQHHLHPRPRVQGRGRRRRGGGEELVREGDTRNRTYLLDVDLDMFGQVPLPDQSGVNVREHAMLGRVLPELQTFIEDHCTGSVCYVI